MRQQVHVNLGERSYTIHIGTGILDELGDLCRDVIKPCRVLLVSDSNVGPLYSEKATQSLAGAGFTVAQAEVPAGEESKSLPVLSDLYSRAVSAGLDRDSAVIALGGGMVGDLAGFLAATFLRGIGLVQVPTSLLAMVDSSVGGKTGVNLPEGKNLVGAFHQPRLVVTDPATLHTLAEREYVSGLAEVVKYGVIRSAGLLALLEERAEDMLARDGRLLEEVIAECCAIKARVVEEDERESGGRQVLNFGHTLGHAIETVMAYRGILHGEAVSVGMIFAAFLSVREAGLPEAEALRLRNILSELGLPVCLPELEWRQLRTAIGVDKKSRAGEIGWVLTPRLGEVRWGCRVSEEALEETWRRVKELEAA
ncbi:MAG: 3-dehydroquinate synthase [Verrucomicrobia bacterium]|nr:MAG: 3-dehydroquinate synthase [Verrucomicrobiota bacterium]